MTKIESLDRRAFLRGMTLTSAGLMVPRKTFGFWSLSDDDYVTQCMRGRSRVKPGSYRLRRPIVVGAGEALLIDGSCVEILHGGSMIHSAAIGSFVSVANSLIDFTTNVVLEPAGYFSGKGITTRFRGTVKICIYSDVNTRPGGLQA